MYKDITAVNQSHFEGAAVPTIQVLIPRVVPLLRISITTRILTFLMLGDDKIHLH